MPEKLAIVFGTESVGCTEEILNAADLRVYLPLRGFADSLNLSVAAALVIHELFHLCPEAVGAMSEDERSGLREKWFTQLAAARVQTRAEVKHARDVRNKLEKLRRKQQQRHDREEVSAAASAARAAGKEGKDGVADDAREKMKIEAEAAALEAEAAAIEEARWAAARAAVAPHLANPPPVLRDMRRPDEHREAFVGPNVRARNAEHWAGMAAVAHSSGMAANTIDTIRKHS